MFFTDAISKLVQGENLNALQQAFDHLSCNYRQGETKLSADDLLAYLVTRLPATYAAAKAVFGQVEVLRPQSFLDLGAGPGSASFAAAELFPTLSSWILIEKIAPFLDLGKKLMQKHPLFSKATFQVGDLKELPFPKADLVCFSYSYGEMEDLGVLDKAWEAAGEALILIEPGTPRGYASMIRARTHLLYKGAHMLAPCPHGNVCPMQSPQWCHFATRLQRSSLHRKIKGGELSYEDEKFSYVVLTKHPHLLPDARLLHAPKKRSGHLYAAVCAKEGLKTVTLSKRHGALYKEATRKEWGDALSLPQK